MFVGKWKRERERECVCVCVLGDALVGERERVVSAVERDCRDFMYVRQTVSRGKKQPPLKTLTKFLSSVTVGIHNSA